MHRFTEHNESNYCFIERIETSQLSTVLDKAVTTDLLINGLKQHLKKKVF